MLAVNPYLSFNGNCETAFNFYRSVFGGHFSGLYRYKDIFKQTIPESEREKIMHISLRLTQHVELIGSDSFEAYGHSTKFGDCLSFSICAKSIEEAQRIFAMLSEGGNVVLPLDKTPWADLYGVFTDKFGISWMINYCSEDKNQEPPV